MNTKKGFYQETEAKKNNTLVIVAIISGIATIVGAIIVSISHKPLSENTEIKDNKNSPIARDIQTQNNNYYYSDSKDSNKKKFLNQGFQKNNSFLADKKNDNDKIEVSIQLRNNEGGIKSIKLNEKDAEILPASTLNNPRILVENAPNKIQTIVIITKNGDTCVLQRIFDKKFSKDFPIRFLPDCKTESSD